MTAKIFRDQKAQKWVRGRKDSSKILKSGLTHQDMIWFHCSSLGEFEQARPVLEEIKKRQPEEKILLTFFSPSGYEIQKDYKFAEIVMYLPNDTAANAEKFFDRFHVKLGVFVKYDLWYHILSEAKKRQVPLILISAIFRRDHIFFSLFGGLHKKMLRYFDQIFVQNKSSYDILQKNNFKNTKIAFDTRFDRVLQIAYEIEANEQIDVFKSDYKCIVAGSTWSPDEDILIPWILQHPKWRLVLAPHEIHEEHLKAIEKKCEGKSIRYSQGVYDLKQQVMIIDNIGLLSSLYYYADVSYVGGGFGVSVHNVLEAAVYEKPVIFGPNHLKSQEAIELVKNKGGFEIISGPDFASLMQRFESAEERKTAGVRAEDYVIERKGGANVILKYLANKKIIDN